MIPGTAASRGRPQSIAGGGGDPGPGTFDFVNGLYNWGATSYSAADVITHTELLGAGGLEIPSAGSTPRLILPAATAFLQDCDFTAYGEVDGTTGNRMYIFTVSEVTLATWIEILWWGDFSIDHEDGVNNPVAEDLTFYDTGVHKFAVTRQNGRVAISVDGNAVVEDLTSCTLPVTTMTDFYFGGFSAHTENDFNLHNITFQSPVDNATLVTLSTP